MQPPNKKFANILFLVGFDEIAKFSARQYFYVYGIQSCRVYVSISEYLLHFEDKVKITQAIQIKLILIQVKYD